MKELLAEEITEHFCFQGEVISLASYGSGHINDTFQVQCQQADGKIKRYILQRMNQEIFKKPLELMENILGVTSWLKKKILEAGGDPNRETMNVIRTHSGDVCYLDESGQYWRAYDFIEGATSYDKVEKAEDFYESAVAFGHFQRLLSDYPAQTLYETIPDFHNTGDRFKKFEKAVAADVCKRAKSVAEEIAFFRKRQNLSVLLGEELEKGNLPLRVTHNDTKLNNIMIDDESHKGICVIDLDTVMPGLALHDFGDSIRFGASTAAEDEQDLSKVSFSLELFELYTKGFIEGCAGSLTKNELKLLPMGAIVMTYECGMRFLTDYLSGDIYFKTHRPRHNLDRARTQCKLVEDMEKNKEKMDRIVQKYCEEKE